MKHWSKILFLAIALALVVGALAISSSAQAGDLAAIGNTEYATLAAAVAAAQDGDTIIVLEHQTVENPITVTGKTIIVDLNGKTVSSELDLFVLGNGGNLSVVGEGIFVAGNGAILRVNNNVTGAEATLGDGQNPIRINDNLAMDNASLISMAEGKFTMNKTEISILKKTGGTHLSFGNTEVAMNDSSIISYTAGGPVMVAFTRAGTLLKFRATNCVFDQTVLAADVGSSAPAGKASAFVLPSCSSAATTPLPGSYFIFDNCFIGTKWGMFINNGELDIDPDIMPIECNNCEIFMRNGNFAYNKDSRFGRQVHINFTDCSFNDMYSRSNPSELVAMGGSVTYAGDTRTKYGLLPVQDSTKSFVPAGYAGYYMREDTTGYPYLYTADTVDPSTVIKLVQIMNNMFSDLRRPSNLSIDNKKGKGDYANVQQTQDEYIVTQNGSNAYFRWYALNTIPKGSTQDANMNFVISSRGQHPFSQYRYFTWDFDFMTDTEYIVGLDSAVIGRNDSGALSFSGGTNNLVFRIRQDANGVYFEQNGQRIYVGRDAWKWHHITAIIVVDSEGLDTIPAGSGQILIYTYVDGQRLNDVPLAAVIGNNTCTYLNQFRFMYNTGTVEPIAGQAVCFDNVAIKAYEIVDTQGGYIDPIAPLLADPTLTLAEANYPDYNSTYTAPEVAPIVRAGSVYFQDFEEAYLYAKNNGLDLTLLRDFTAEVDIDAALRIYTGGIEWVPTEDSWGFVRGEDPVLGEYYEFSAALNEGVQVWWYSNPFNMDPDIGYAYLQTVKGGRRIAHPAEDTNHAKLDFYGVKDSQNNYTIYRFVGWTDDPNLNEIIEVFPVVDAALISSGDLFYFAVYEEITPLYVTSGVSVALLDYDDILDEDVERTYTVYYGGETLADLRNFIEMASGTQTIVLMDDIVTNINSQLFVVPPDANLTFDLNGHLIAHVPEGKYAVFSSDGALTITSSVPGGMIEGRAVVPGSTNANWGAGAFETGPNGRITIHSPNIHVRCVIFYETSQPGGILDLANLTIEQVGGDSWACFMIRSNANITVNMNNVLYFGTSTNRKQLFDIGNGVNSVSNIVINVTNSKIIYLPASAAMEIANRFPGGAVINVTGTVGNYLVGATSPMGVGGVINVGVGNRFAEPISERAIYAGTQLATGLVVARQWALSSLADRWPNGLISVNPYYAAESYLNYNDGEVRIYVLDSSYKVRYGTYEEEDVAAVNWYNVADTNSFVLHSELWVKTEANPYYSNTVPSRTETQGPLTLTCSFPRDAWALFQTDLDGVRHYAPDMAQMYISDIVLSGLKQNVVFYSDFAMNVFVPKTAYATAVRYNEIVLPMIEREIDGQTYYVVRVTVGADEAADRITLEIALTVDGEQTFYQTVSTNVAAYAAALSESEAYSDLGYAMLRYAKAAYLYTAEEHATLPDALDVADTDVHAPMRTAVNTITSGAVTGIALELGEKPIFVMTLDGVFAGTVTVSYTGADGLGKTIHKEVLAGDTMIGLPEIRLYDLDATLTITAGNAEVGSYNLAAYAAVLEDHEQATAVLIALNDYLVAAGAYRFPVGN